MLTPKKVKHRKWHKGRGRFRDAVASRIVDIAFGQYAIKAVSAGWIDSRQIEAARRAITRHVKRGGKVWIRIFPDKPVSSKGSQTTMGGGKGGPAKYVAVVKPGTVLFEMDGVTEEIAKESLRLAAFKLPIKTRFIAK